MKHPLTFIQNHFLLYLNVLCLKKTDVMLGSGVLSVTPESRSLWMKGGSRVSPCAHSPVPHL